MAKYSEITVRNLTELLEDKNITNIIYNSEGDPSTITYSNGYYVDLYYTSKNLVKASYHRPDDSLDTEITIEYDGNKIKSVEQTSGDSRY